MEDLIAWGALASLIVFTAGGILLLNKHYHSVRDAMTPEERKDDDDDADAFTQQW